MYDFSFFKAPVKNTKPIETISPMAAYLRITGENYRERTEQLRAIANKAEARMFKAANFDYVTFSGTFSSRSDKALIEHSELLCIDFDHLDMETQAYLPEQLKNDPFFDTMLLFRSPSGDGLKWIIPIDPERATHLNWFLAVGNYIKSSYKIDIDQSGKDVSRACFLPYDPACYIGGDNVHSMQPFDLDKWLQPVAQATSDDKQHKAKNTEKKCESVKEYAPKREGEDFPVIFERIMSARVDIAPEYQDWLHLGFALADAFGAAGEKYYHDLSSLHHDYTESATDKQWQACLKSHGHGVSLKTFYALAKNAGIDVSVKSGNKPQNSEKKYKSAKVSQPAPTPTPDLEIQIFGLDLLEDAYLDNDNKPVPAVILCHTREDYDVCLRCNAKYYALWHPKIHEKIAEHYEKLFGQKACAETVYYITTPEYRAERKKLAEKYIALRPVQLPKAKLLQEYLTEMSDSFATQDKMFNKMLAKAYPLQFWEWVKASKDTRLEINSVYLHYNLRFFGFRTYYQSPIAVGEKANEKTIFVKLQDGVITPVLPKEIRTHILNFAAHKSTNLAVLKLVQNSPLCKSTVYDDLPEVEVNKKDYTATMQRYHCKNGSVEITADTIKLQPLSRCIFSTNIVPHDYETLPPVLAWDKPENRVIDGNFRINYKNLHSHYARFLLNTSRLCWREELESDKHTDQENAAYAQKYKFSLCGDRLTDEQREKQLQNFAAKCYAIGYLFHRYKDPSKAWLVYGLEETMRKSKESNGGTGKSLTMTAIKNMGLTKFTPINGRNKELTKNQFGLSKIKKDTAIAWIDECYMYFDLQFFFQLVTGDMELNEKQEKSQIIDFSESAKFILFSNYPPKEIDGSKTRRLLYFVFSDYYHQKNETNTYRETRKVYHDFGYNICYGEQYKEEWWNEDMNFLFECIRYYLACSERDVIVEPPLEKVHALINQAEIGDKFEEWADEYFHLDNERLNREILKSDIWSDLSQNDIRGIGINSLYKLLSQYCNLRGYTLNPLDAKIEGMRIRETKKGKVGIIRRANTEYYYIQAPETPKQLAETDDDENVLPI